MARGLEPPVNSILAEVLNRYRTKRKSILPQFLVSDISNCPGKGKVQKISAHLFPTFSQSRTEIFGVAVASCSTSLLGVANQLVGHGACILSGVIVAGGEATDVTCNRLERIINTDVAVSDCLQGVACCPGQHGGFGERLVILATSLLEDMDV